MISVIQPSLALVSNNQQVMTYKVMTCHVNDNLCAVIKLYTSEIAENSHDISYHEN